MLVHIRRMGGNVLSVTGEDMAIGELNPICYKGYYRDTETGLYYLQSRYYDPTTMRFINGDDPNIIQMGSNEKQELNLYFPHIRAHVADTHLSVSNAPPPFITVFSRISFLFLFLAEFQINILLRCRILKQTR